MLRFISVFNGLPIQSLRNGRQIATLDKPIINPHKLSVEAFYVDQRALAGDSVIFTSDIREISNIGAIVDSEDSFMEINDLVRLEELIKIKFDVISKQVITTNKRKVGKVFDYAIDDRTFTIEKIYVRPSFSKSLIKSDVIIGRRQIAEVTDTQIIVKDTEIKVGSTKRKLSLNPLSN